MQSRTAPFLWKAMVLPWWTLAACGGTSSDPGAPSTTTSASVGAGMGGALGSGGAAAGTGGTGGTVGVDDDAATGDIDSGGADGSMDSAGGAALHHIGGACASDVDCIAGLTCDTSTPRGRCTKSCAVNADCGGVDVCVGSACY